MNYATIKPVDTADGIGCRVALYVSGCTRHCPGCHNLEAQAFDYGKPFTDETLEELLSLLAPSYIHGISLLGGEPLHPENLGTVTSIVHAIRKAYPSKSIWIYTGYTYETIHNLSVLSEADVLVDGEYIESLRDLGLRFRGSSNQRIIDLPKSTISGSAVLWEDSWKGARM